MKHKISPQLKKFYQEIAAWVDNGCPQHVPVFLKNRSLCTTLAQWSGYDSKIRREQTELFKKSGLNETLPFDKNFEKYNIDLRDGRFYENPKRLDFIRKYAA